MWRILLILFLASPQTPSGWLVGTARRISIFYSLQFVPAARTGAEPGMQEADLYVLLKMVLLKCEYTLQKKIHNYFAHFELNSRSV